MAKVYMRTQPQHDPIDIKEIEALRLKAECLEQQKQNDEKFYK
jgi:hypothetical protein